MPPITLTTDFGFHDAYVAAMKGVILGIDPAASIVDVCHCVGPQNVLQAAFVLGTVHDYFPAGTVHIVVVDPEVGGSRRAIALASPRAFFLAPDNGVLSYVLGTADAGQGEAGRPLPVDLPAGFQAVEITNPDYWRQPVSSTFHGRDIFAPVAAYLSLGVPLSAFGGAITQVHAFPIPHPRRVEGGVWVGHVVHIDGFGNVITDFAAGDLPAGGFQVQIAAQTVDAVGNIYAEAEVNQPLALIGSTGYLEIAVRNGSAASLLGVRVGDEVWVRGI